MDQLLDKSRQLEENLFARIRVLELLNDKNEFLGMNYQRQIKSLENDVKKQKKGKLVAIGAAGILGIILIAGK